MMPSASAPTQHQAVAFAEIAVNTAVEHNASSRGKVLLSQQELRPIGESNAQESSLPSQHSIVADVSVEAEVEPVLSIFSGESHLLETIVTLTREARSLTKLLAGYRRVSSALPQVTARTATDVKLAEARDELGLLSSRLAFLPRLADLFSRSCAAIPAVVRYSNTSFVGEDEALLFAMLLQELFTLEQVKDGSPQVLSDWSAFKRSCRTSGTQEEDVLGLSSKAVLQQWLLPRSVMTEVCRWLTSVMGWEMLIATACSEAVVLLQNNQFGLARSSVFSFERHKLLRMLCCCVELHGMYLQQLAQSTSSAALTAAKQGKNKTSPLSLLGKALSDACGQLAAAGIPAIPLDDDCSDMYVEVLPFVQKYDANFALGPFWAVTDSKKRARKSLAGAKQPGDDTAPGDTDDVGGGMDSTKGAANRQQQRKNSTTSSATCDSAQKNGAQASYCGQTVMPVSVYKEGCSHLKVLARLATTAKDGRRVEQDATVAAAEDDPAATVGPVVDALTFCYETRARAVELYFFEKLHADRARVAASQTTAASTTGAATAEAEGGEEDSSATDEAADEAYSTFFSWTYYNSVCCLLSLFHEAIAAVQPQLASICASYTHSVVQSFVQSDIRGIVRKVVAEKRPESTAVLVHLREVLGDWGMEDGASAPCDHCLDGKKDDGSTRTAPAFTALFRNNRPQSSVLFAVAAIVRSLISERGPYMRREKFSALSAGKPAFSGERKATLQLFHTNISLLLAINELCGLGASDVTSAAFLYARESQLEREQRISLPLAMSAPYNILVNALPSANPTSITAAFYAYSSAATVAVTQLRRSHIHDEIRAEVSLAFDCMLCYIAHRLFMSAATVAAHRNLPHNPEALRRLRKHKKLGEKHVSGALTDAFRALRGGSQGTSNQSTSESLKCPFGRDCATVAEEFLVLCELLTVHLPHLGLEGVGPITPSCVVAERLRLQFHEMISRIHHTIAHVPYSMFFLPELGAMLESLKQAHSLLASPHVPGHHGSVIRLLSASSLAQQLDVLNTKEFAEVFATKLSKEIVSWATVVDTEAEGVVFWLSGKYRERASRFKLAHSLPASYSPFSRLFIRPKEQELSGEVRCGAKKGQGRQGGGKAAPKGTTASKVSDGSTEREAVKLWSAQHSAIAREMLLTRETLPIVLAHISEEIVFKTKSLLLPSFTTLAQHITPPMISSSLSFVSSDPKALADTFAVTVCNAPALVSALRLMNSAVADLGGLLHMLRGLDAESFSVMITHRLPPLMRQHFGESHSRDFFAAEVSHASSIWSVYSFFLCLDAEMVEYSRGLCAPALVGALLLNVTRELLVYRIRSVLHAILAAVDADAGVVSRNQQTRPSKAGKQPSTTTTASNTATPAAQQESPVATSAPLSDSKYVSMAQDDATFNSFVERARSFVHQHGQYSELCEGLRSRW